MALSFIVKSEPGQTQHGLIQGPAGQLEVMVSRAASAPEASWALICHPHPLHQGTMNNKVVTTLHKAFSNLGISTLRFNYRGVGKSEGRYGETVGESEDCLALLRWIQEQAPDASVRLAGFSFGAYIAANVASQETVSHLLTIAPAVHHAPFEALSDITCPWLVIMGEQDEIVPFESVQQWYDNLSADKTLITMEEAGHFFHGDLVTLRQLIEAHY